MGKTILNFIIFCNIVIIMQISAEKVARIMALVDDGKSQRYAAQVVVVPETTARRAIQRYAEKSHCRRRAGSGRPKCTTNVDDRFRF
jgi:transposase